MNISSTLLQRATLSRIFFVVVLLVIALSCAHVAQAASESEADTTQQHVVTIYDQGKKRVVLTKASTLRDTLDQADISMAQHDRVEPSIDTQFVANEYTVNIYRAHPVMIIDGMKREQILTPYTSPRDIAKDAKITTRDEDALTLSGSTDMLSDGMGTRLVIERAKAVNLVLYGTQNTVYTRSATVADFLREKSISLSAADTISVDTSTPITEGISVEIWRDGTQTVTSEEAVAFPVRQVLDADSPVGYKEIQTPGAPGRKQVVYEVVRQAGKEVSRKVIQSVVVLEPQEQVEIVGNKTGNALTKSKGAQQFTDSKGVSHRETYYDLPMNVTMGACGGGDYTIRTDGAKVDKDGYILIAANLGNYPRCSIVETSMGLGKVYDTGGFAAVHPHGFDLATDWTNNDGR